MAGSLSLLARRCCSDTSICTWRAYPFCVFPILSSTCGSMFVTTKAWLPSSSRLSSCPGGWYRVLAGWPTNPPSPPSFAIPQPSTGADSDEWSWEVVREVPLRLSARVASPHVAAGPSLGSWPKTVDYFRLRSRGYVLAKGGLQAVQTSQRSVPVWPLRVSMEDPSLLVQCLQLNGDLDWPELHSAWLCPEVPYQFRIELRYLARVTASIVGACGTGSSHVQGQDGDLLESRRLSREPNTSVLAFER